MPKLTDYSRYADAQTHFSPARLWVRAGVETSAAAIATAHAGDMRTMATKLGGRQRSRNRFGAKGRECRD